METEDKETRFALEVVKGTPLLEVKEGGYVTGPITFTGKHGSKVHIPRATTLMPSTIIDI